jgi:hypothetical protein
MKGELKYHEYSLLIDNIQAWTNSTRQLYRDKNDIHIANSPTAAELLERGKFFTVRKLLIYIIN